MGKLGSALAFVLVLGLLGLAYFLWQTAEEGARPPPVVVAPPQAPIKPIEAPPPPQVETERYPVPPIEEPQDAAAEPEKAVPAETDVDDSDARLQAAIEELLPNPVMRKLLNLDGFVRRFVATVDNLPRDKMARRLSPLVPAEGAFVVDGDSLSGMSIGAANAMRYEPFVTLLESVDLKRAVGAYVRLYPLFQQAYRDLGYPSGYFNDRMVEVIDHLLTAPVLQQPVRLVQPKVFYEYADPELERLSAGHKLLARMGPRNAARVQARLHTLRDLLASARH